MMADGITTLHLLNETFLDVISCQMYKFSYGSHGIGSFFY